MERFAAVATEYAREAAREGVSGKMLMSILWEKMQASEELKVPLAVFKTKTPGEPGRNWQGLLDIINTRVEHKRNVKLQEERAQGIFQRMRGEKPPGSEEPLSLIHI